MQKNSIFRKNFSAVFHNWTNIRRIFRVRRFVRSLVERNIEVRLAPINYTRNEDMWQRTRISDTLAPRVSHIPRVTPRGPSFYRVLRYSMQSLAFFHSSGASLRARSPTFGRVLEHFPLSFVPHLLFCQVVLFACFHFVHPSYFHPREACSGWISRAARALVWIRDRYVIAAIGKARAVTSEFNSNSRVMTVYLSTDMAIEYSL